MPHPAGSINIEPVGETFRFVVRRSFVLGGRGTVALGYIEAGTVRVGDELMLLHGDERRSVRCAGIAGGVRIADWKSGDPAPVGLMLPELQPNELAAGDLLVSPTR